MFGYSYWRVTEGTKSCSDVGMAICAFATVRGSWYYPVGLKHTDVHMWCMYYSNSEKANYMSPEGKVSGALNSWIIKREDKICECLSTFCATKFSPHLSSIFNLHSTASPALTGTSHTVVCISCVDSYIRENTLIIMTNHVGIAKESLHLYTNCTVLFLC